MYSRQQGFTVPEVLIAIGIAGAIIVGIVVILVNLSSNSASIVHTSEQIRSNQSALSTIQADMPLTHAFLGTNDLVDPDASASPISPDGWKVRGTNADSNILILQTYATTAHPQDPSRQIVYLDDGAGGCPIGRQAVTNNIIYFVKDGTLYRRVVPAVPAPGTRCRDNSNNELPIAQIRTCSTTATGPAACSERDVVVATNVNRFSVQYFNEAGDADALDAVYTSSDEDADGIVQTARAIRIDIQTQNSESDSTTSLNSYRKMTKGTARDY